MWCPGQTCYAAMLGILDPDEKQTGKGVTVETQGCCGLLLKSSNEAQSMFPVLGKPVVHQCWAFETWMEGKLTKV